MKISFLYYYQNSGGCLLSVAVKSKLTGTVCIKFDSTRLRDGNVTFVERRKIKQSCPLTQSRTYKYNFIRSVLGSFQVIQLSAPGSS